MASPSNKTSDDQLKGVDYKTVVDQPQPPKMTDTLEIDPCENLDQDQDFVYDYDLLDYEYDSDLEEVHPKEVNVVVDVEKPIVRKE